MSRLAFLDWTRGIAVLVMIQCHAFNAFTRADLRGTPAYVFSQFVGGMAAPLFLLLAGATFAFQMDKLDRSNALLGPRLLKLLKRGGYVLLLAYLFRLSNTLSRFPHPVWSTLWKVDILNSMGAGMILLSLLTLAPSRVRAQVACLAGLAIASASPLVRSLDWSGVLPQVAEYFVPNPARFPLFPYSAYVSFGIAAGLVIRRTPRERLERALEWGALLGFVMMVGAQYFSNLPFSLYEKVDFWIDSPALVIIKTGICWMTLAGGFLWTEYLVRPKAGWVQVFGKTSLLVYWVHVMIVYGLLAEAWGGKLTVLQTTAGTALVIVLMVGLAYARLWQKDWWTARAAPRQKPVMTA